MMSGRLCVFNVVVDACLQLYNIMIVNEDLLIAMCIISEEFIFRGTIKEWHLSTHPHYCTSSLRDYYTCIIILYKEGCLYASTSDGDIPSAIIGQLHNYTTSHDHMS